jgi:hypothetical protein
MKMVIWTVLGYNICSLDCTYVKSRTKINLGYVLILNTRSEMRKLRNRVI